MLNYKIECVINNWFKYDYDRLDYDALSTREATKDTIYCGWCTTRKAPSLMTYTYDAKNRRVNKCKSCATKHTKGVKNA